MLERHHGCCDVTWAMQAPSAYCGRQREDCQRAFARSDRPFLLVFRH
jgi:hypothetical protein